MVAKKNILTSIQLVATVTVLSVVYGFATLGTFTYAYVFTANFGVGVIILIGGLSVLAVPTFLLIKKSRLIDHTTYVHKFVEEREHKRARAYELIHIGIYQISITAVVQFVAWFAFNDY